jgi:hypothetical protein
MKYQFVIQFSEELHDNLEWISEIENRLDASLVDSVVDGHDVGSGQVNIYIHTDNAISTFEIVKNMLKEGNSLDNAKIAYREINGDNYVCLWPTDLINFKVV